MVEEESISRRQFVALMARASVLGWAISETLRILPSMHAQMSTAKPTANSWKALTLHQALTVRAFVAEIIPTDKDLGAAEVGTAEFIDGLINLSPRLKQHYAAGLAGVDEISRLSFNRPFIELVPEQRRKVIRSMERNSALPSAWQGTTAKEFFATVRYHTLISYFSNPKVFPSLSFPGPGAYFTTVGKADAAPSSKAEL